MKSYYMLLYACMYRVVHRDNVLPDGNFFMLHTLIYRAKYFRLCTNDLIWLILNLNYIVSLKYIVFYDYFQFLENYCTGIFSSW